MDARARWRDHLAASATADPADRSAGDTLTVGIAASFTPQPLEAFVGTALLDAGVGRPRVVFADYNQIHQACLDPASVFGVELDRIALLWRIEDVFESNLIAALEGDRAAADELLDGIADLAAMVAQCARREGIPIVASIPPTPDGFGIDRLDAASSVDIGRLHDRATAIVIDQLADVDGVRLLDHRRLVEEIGAGSAHDLRSVLLYRQPYRPAMVELLGTELGRSVAAFDRVPPKVIALDCDNTLWGGIVGEDGPDDVQIGSSFPGSAFRDFQLALRRLSRRGVLLAICSKNNPEDVDEVFNTRSDLALRADDIAAWRVNWEPKSANLAAIARELNLGLESFVFVDDSDFELAEVAAAHPQVRCLRVPDDLEELPELLAGSGLFRSMRVSDEDRKRTDMVRQERRREAAKAEISPEAFLASLGLRVEFFRVDGEHVGRVTQLINKTNQFNLTTRRRSETDVAALIASPTSAVHAIRVADRFGDYGLVGVVVTEATGADWEIDTFLMSCRVLRRGVETAMLAAVAEMARAAGARRLLGRYEPSAKNAQVAGFFGDHGFDVLGEGRFAFDLAGALTKPDHIDLVTDA
jgi:FkbH-like protein